MKFKERERSTFAVLWHTVKIYWADSLPSKWRDFYSCIFSSKTINMMYVYSNLYYLKGKEFAQSIFSVGTTYIALPSNWGLVKRRVTASPGHRGVRAPEACHEPTVWCHGGGDRRWWTRSQVYCGPMQSTSYSWHRVNTESQHTELYILYNFGWNKW